MGATAAIALANLASGYAQGEAARARGAFEQQQFEINSRFAEREARDVLKRGDKEAAAHGKRIKSTIGKQRTLLAAQGVSVDTGTALDIQEQTREIGLEEMETIRNNAWRESFGLKQQARSGRASGRLSKLAGDFEARNTLITGGLSALDFYARNSPQDSSFSPPSQQPTGDTALVWDPAKVGGIS